MIEFHRLTTDCLLSSWMLLIHEQKWLKRNVKQRSGQSDTGAMHLARQQVSVVFVKCGKICTCTQFVVKILIADSSSSMNDSKQPAVLLNALTVL